MVLEQRCPRPEKLTRPQQSRIKDRVQGEARDKGRVPALGGFLGQQRQVQTARAQPWGVSLRQGVRCSAPASWIPVTSSLCCSRHWGAGPAPIKAHPGVFCHLLGWAIVPGNGGWGSPAALALASRLLPSQEPMCSFPYFHSMAFGPEASRTFPTSDVPSGHHKKWARTRQEEMLPLLFVSPAHVKCHHPCSPWLSPGQEDSCPFESQKLCLPQAS